MFDEFFDRIDRVHKQKQDEFEKLRLDQSAAAPQIGDTVVVAAGPLKMGFEWVRYEAVVIALGSSRTRCGSRIARTSLPANRL